MKTSSLIVCIVLGLSASCARMTVHTDYDPDVDFPKYRSFNWMPRIEEREESAPVLTEPFLEKRIKKAILESMAAKGYEKKTGVPDFLIAFHINYKKKTEVNVHGHGYWGRRPVDVYRYKEGTLILDFVDPKTNQLIWRGWSISAIDAASSPREEQRNINKAVKEILGRFPPY